MVQFNRPSVELISNIVEPELSAECQEYDEQMAGIEVIEYAEKGLAVNAAINSIENCGMGNTYGLLFFPEYAAGTKGSAGTKGCGQLKQWGSQYLATKGYTCKQILNYYYSGSEYSPVGDVMLFTYSIGY